MPDFKAMLRPLRFDKPPEEAEAEADQVPKPLLRPADQARRFSQLREAAAILDVLPGPGESLHALMTGRYDLCDLIGVMIERLGRVEHLRIATLALAPRNAEALKGWLTSGQVGRLSLLVSEYFRAHNSDLFEDLRTFLAEKKGCRLQAARSHCKIIYFEFDAARYVLYGSANLRTNSNIEQFVLSQDGELADWYARFIDALIAKHGSRNDGKRTG